MVSTAVHYLLYLAISVCVLAPLVAAIIIRKVGTAGVWPYAVGILMYISITSVQSFTSTLLQRTGMGEIAFYIVAGMFIAGIEVLGFYFFMRVLVKERYTQKFLAAGAMYGGTLGIMYSFTQILLMITVIIAINKDEIDKILETAGENASLILEYKETVMTMTVLEALPLVVYGAVCVMFFTFLGALLANAADGKPIYYLYAFLAAVVYEVPAILITNLAGEEIIAIAYQLLVAIVAAILIRRVVDETTDITINNATVINRPLR